MNQRLSEATLRALARELLGSAPACTGRHFRRMAQARFTAAGNTARMFRIWREERERWIESRRITPAGDESVAALGTRMRAAQEEADAQRARAERAEYREQAHQDHWALEIDRLREQLRSQPDYAAEVRRLQSRIQGLVSENAALRNLLTPGEPAQAADHGHRLTGHAAGST